MTDEKLAEMEAMLRKLAGGECWHDDPEFNAYEFSGGNSDDAYYGGMEAGRIVLAGELVAKYFGEGG